MELSSKHSKRHTQAHKTKDQAKDCINCEGDYSDGTINENSNLDINIL